MDWPDTRTLSLLVLLSTTLLAAAPGAQPFVPGLLADPPLTPAERGELLASELRCTACHAPMAPSLLPSRGAPLLAGVGGRVEASYLRRFLAEPAAAHPGTSMPDLLGTRPADEREEIAEALTAYLLSLSSDRMRPEPLAAADSERGRELYHRVGCVACHAPDDSPDEPGSLAFVAGKYGLESLSAFLFQPLLTRPSGRMPDLGLTRDEARQIASYLLASDRTLAEGTATSSAGDPASGDPQAGTPAEPKVDLGQERVDRGEALFQELGCAACHSLAKAALPPPAPALAAADPERGCLSGARSDTPFYSLSASQLEALRAFLQADPTDRGARSPEKSDALQVTMTLTAFGCITCHEREGYGGVAAARDTYFTTSEPALGDAARIPPPLTLVGAKLQSPWMRQVLFDGAVARPAMHTRMPRFGEANLAHLPGLLARVDRVEPVAVTEPKGETRNAWRKAGRELLGDKGLGCITCHTFGGKASPGFQGIDLLLSTQRLEPSWFHHFLRDPTGFRPGITMPSSWPQGVALRSGILDGNTEEQLQAIWHYLSLGRSAPDPSGIRSPGTRLEVEARPRLYRGRSRVAGYRGIAVGLPGGLNYGFNAQTGTLSALWPGDFVSVNWGSQGAGNWNPAARPIELAQDLSFLRLPEDEAPWPLRPRTTKEKPVNPDPLYPRNHGYRFGGYYFDEDGVPTLMYRIDDLEIEDRSTADLSGEAPVLRRTLRFSAAGGRIWFRALTGGIEALSPTRYQTEALTLTLPPGRVLLRPFAVEEEAATASELLVELVIPAEGTLLLTYELRSSR